MGELEHECGVAAVYHNHAGNDGVSDFSPWFTPDQPGESPFPHAFGASRLIPNMLLDQQNRGQLASGMTSYNPNRGALLSTHKKLGMVAEGFRMGRKDEFEEIKLDHQGPAAIGHVRYATVGGDDKRNAQPFEREHGRKAKWFAFAFNGQLANYEDLKRELFKEDLDYHLRGNTDTEILMHHLSHELQNVGMTVDWRAVFTRLAAKFDGSYNIVLLSATGDLVVSRDPLGMRPLCFAQDGPLFAAASESVPLQNIGFKQIQSLEPGTLLVVNNDGVRKERYSDTSKRAHCFFEWIYFANVASTLDERSVYLSRAALGTELAILDKDRFDPADTIVVPVPDTAKAAADAMAHALQLPSREGLMRNRYVGRTFIEGTADREAMVRRKFTPLPEVLEGKRVILVEDSIVRSTTMRSLISLIRNRGRAREIHLRVACPPIIAPCYYGIDMSKIKELFAPPFSDQPNGGFSEEAMQKMANELCVDSLRYLSVEAIARAVGFSSDRLCQACVTGNYPTPTGERLYQVDLDKWKKDR